MTPLQTHHMYSTLKRRGNHRFHVASTWNTRDVFVGRAIASGKGSAIETIAQSEAYLVPDQT